MWTVLGQQQMLIDGLALLWDVTKWQHTTAIPDSVFGYDYYEQEGVLLNSKGKLLLQMTQEWLSSLNPIQFHNPTLAKSSNTGV